MGLEVIVSSSPSLDFEGEPDSEPLRTWFRDLKGPEGWHSWWIVPTSRRRRAVVRNTLESSRLPRVFTLEGLAQHLTGLSRIQFRTIGNTGRLLRIAKAFRDVEPRTPLTVGRVQQIEQFASQWRASHAAAPSSRDSLGLTLRKYDDLIKKDRCLDTPALLRELATDLSDPTGPLARLIRDRRILFDGYHRFSDAELELIEAIAKHAKVRLWLVGVKEQPYYPSVERILNRLQIVDLSVDSRIPTSALADFGRAVFKSDSKGSAPVVCHIAPNRDVECQVVAAQIKETVRTQKVRLADIAVVIPDDSYLPLLKESLVAAGIQATPGAESFVLADSRPARLLLSALRLIRHGWLADALFDFLRQPFVFRQLADRHLLDWLRERSTLAAARNDARSWLKQWNESIDHYENGSRAADESRDEDPNIRAERVKTLAASLRKLTASIEDVLVPIEIFEREVAGSEPKNFKVLVTAIARWLGHLDIDQRLSPAEHRNWTVIPAREWEIDQLAFNNLKDVLTELNDLPERDLPLSADKDVEIELVMKLALAAETFQTSAEDDAGVQILRVQTIRGSRFHTIFAVGMVEGFVPQDPGYTLEKGEVGSTKRAWREEDLHEQQYLFTQLFESARERLLLSRPEQQADVPLMESPFLRATRRKLGLDRIPRFPAIAIVDFRDALADPAIAAFLPPSMAPLLNDRKRWKQRQLDAELQIEPWAIPLLRLRYPNERAFSATSLERYATCPFQHFAAKTLGLEDLERDDTAMRWGSFLHDVLDKAFKLKDDQRPMNERFQAMLQKHWPDVASTLDITYLNDFEKALFDAYLAVTTFLEENGFSQIESEWERKAVPITGGTSSTILLHVKIDRIDYRESDGVELICDFKTGLMTEGSKLLSRIERGRALQLPLYGLARQIEKPGVSVKHGIYVKLSRRVEGDRLAHGPFVVEVGEIAPTKKRIKIPFDPGAAGKKAVALANNMLAGKIELTLFDSDDKDPACNSYCPARHSCRHPNGY